jgi:hypothetical protein
MYKLDVYVKRVYMTRGRVTARVSILPYHNEILMWVDIVQMDVVSRGIPKYRLKQYFMLEHLAIKAVAKLDLNIVHTMAVVNYYF